MDISLTVAAVIILSLYVIVCLVVIFLFYKLFKPWYDSIAERERELDERIKDYNEKG